jgi:hypothetical protein
MKLMGNWKIHFHFTSLRSNRNFWMAKSIWQKLWRRAGEWKKMMSLTVKIVSRKISRKKRARKVFFSFRFVFILLILKINSLLLRKLTASEMKARKKRKTKEKRFSIKFQYNARNELISKLNYKWGTANKFYRGRNSSFVSFCHAINTKRRFCAAHAYDMNSI